MSEVKCWICGNAADSGEHLIKASDLRRVFGKISQQKPIFFHDHEKSNIPIGSAKNQRFHSDAKLCKDCNSNKSQPYDNAWDELSTYLIENWHRISTQKKPIHLKKVFKGCSKQKAVDIQLYFAKIFGCRVAEAGINIPLDLFRVPFLNRQVSPNIYLEFGYFYPVKNKHHAIISDIQTANTKGKVLSAAFFYSVGNIDIKVIFISSNATNPEIGKYWHPEKNPLIRILVF